jgi:hypothetical protein
MKLRVMVFTFAILLAAFITVAQEKGAENMDLDGGSRGKVPFPHHIHQNVLKDCNLCHAVFGQEAGVIEKMKSEGKLKKKQVMNKMCTKCHKERKKAREKTGPVTCNQCHVR